MTDDKPTVCPTCKSGNEPWTITEGELSYLCSDWWHPECRPDDKPTCPTCSSTNPAWNGTAKATKDGWLDPINCADAWHDKPTGTLTDEQIQQAHDSLGDANHRTLGEIFGTPDAIQQFARRIEAIVQKDMYRCTPRYHFCRCGAVGSDIPMIGPEIEAARKDERERAADRMDGVFGPSTKGRELSDAARDAILRGEEMPDDRDAVDRADA